MHDTCIKHHIVIYFYETKSTKKEKTHLQTSLIKYKYKYKYKKILIKRYNNNMKKVKK